MMKNPNATLVYKKKKKTELQQRRFDFQGTPRGIHTLLFYRPRF